MNILKNFRNPWEAATEVLKTSVLETGVLEGSVLGDMLFKKQSLNGQGEVFPKSTLSGVDSRSAKRLLNEIQSTFLGTEAEELVKGWYIGKNGLTIEFVPLAHQIINSIKDFDTRMLLKAYFHAMTDNRAHIIEMVRRKEALSKYGQYQLKTDYFKYKTGANVEEQDGGGKSVTANWGEELSHLWEDAGEGAYCVIVMDTIAKISSYSDDVARPSLSGELLAHELLGHGIGRYYDTFQSDGVNESVQMGNLYLRIKKKSYYRMSHGITHPENFNPNGIPAFYLFP
jgi:hypothetical protein